MRQIERGGPVTVMHPDMMRYFISIPEAVSLVIQAGTFGGRGNIYMLDMGEEINILELAERMIRLRGLRPGEDIEVVFTGPRPGEKLREELVADFEQHGSDRAPEGDAPQRLGGDHRSRGPPPHRREPSPSSWTDPDELRRRIHLVARNATRTTRDELPAQAETRQVVNYRVHPTAEVSERASIGEGASVWHQAQVREGATVGAGLHHRQGRLHRRRCLARGELQGPELLAASTRATRSKTASSSAPKSCSRTTATPAPSTPMAR